MNPKAQIFLCYAKEDKPQVEALYQKLKEASFEPWMDKVDLIGGEEWRPAIQKAIRESHFFIACVSKHWIPTNPQDRKRFFRREIQTALDVLPELQQGDIYIIPIRLDDCDVPENLSLFQWIDYFQSDGWDRLVNSIQKGMDRLGFIKPVKLRSQPVVNLSENDVTKIIKEKGFPDTYKNRFGKGLRHQYELIERNGEKLVVDHTTGLAWQQSGSDEEGYFWKAEEYIHDLNKKSFAGYNDWRLPTLEEAMSLMEPEAMNNNSCIDPVFNKTQTWIWTADNNTTLAWVVYFDSGYCSHAHLASGPRRVRAVR